MAKIGLFFGSFNPVHIGHLMIANYFYAETDLDEVWLVVTPQNPWKEKTSLIADEHRVQMAELATSNSNWLKVTQFEKDLEPPYFTYRSLSFLREKYPDNQFVLLIGGDNYERFGEWSNSDEILENHEVWAFPRHSDHEIISANEHIRIFEAPKFEISAERIRKALKKDKDMTYFLPNGVYAYIKQHQLL